MGSRMVAAHTDPALNGHAIARIAPLGTNPVATDPPTRGSRSSKPSDYADQLHTQSIR